MKKIVLILLLFIFIFSVNIQANSDFIILSQILQLEEKNNINHYDIINNFFDLYLVQEKIIINNQLLQIFSKKLDKSEIKLSLGNIDKEEIEQIQGKINLLENELLGLSSIYDDKVEYFYEKINLDFSEKILQNPFLDYDFNKDYDLKKIIKFVKEKDRGYVKLVRQLNEKYNELYTYNSTIKVFIDKFKNTDVSYEDFYNYYNTAEVESYDINSAYDLYISYKELQKSVYDFNSKVKKNITDMYNEILNLRTTYLQARTDEIIKSQKYEKLLEKQKLGISTSQEVFDSFYSYLQQRLLALESSYNFNKKVQEFNNYTYEYFKNTYDNLNTQEQQEQIGEYNFYMEEIVCDLKLKMLTENISYYTVMTVNEEVLNEEYLPISYDFRYLSLIKNDITNLKINFYDSEKALIYTGKLDELGRIIKY